jgi:hypothetical protein
MVVAALRVAVEAVAIVVVVEEAMVMVMAPHLRISMSAAFRMQCPR